jgi:hypothetical protein
MNKFQDEAVFVRHWLVKNEHYHIEADDIVKGSTGVENYE